jgi:hypothetical protein
MSLKKSAGLAAVLVASIAFIVLKNYRSGGDASEETALLFKGFQAKNCSEMLFIERSDTAQLKRIGRTWNLVTPCIPVVPAVRGNTSGPLFPEYSVDSAALAKALETIGKMKRDELVSVNPQKQEELNVDGKSALFFECRDSAGRSLGGIYIGMAGPKSDSYLVRMKGSDSVYLVGDGIRFSLFADPKRWADKSIVRFDKKLVRKLTVVSADSGTIEVEKKEPSSSSGTGAKNEWYLVKPLQAKANQERVESLIASMSNIKAADFEGNGKLSEKEMGFDRPAATTTLTLSNGESKTVIVGGRDKSAMKWVRTPEKPGVTFTVYGYTLAGFNPGTAYLKDTLARDSLSPVESAKSVIEKQIEGSMKNAR